jgi:AraC family transcriptional regulator
LCDRFETARSARSERDSVVAAHWYILAKFDTRVSAPVQRAAYSQCAMAAKIFNYAMIPFYGAKPLRVTGATILCNAPHFGEHVGCSAFEITDSSGSARKLTGIVHLVAMLLDGDCETWWRSDGFGRWRRSTAGAISARSAGPVEPSSWAGDRRMIFVSMTPDFVRSQINTADAEAIERMGAFYCLHEYAPDVERGRHILLDILSLVRSPAPEHRMREAYLAAALVEWLAGVAGARSRVNVDPYDGLTRGQLRRVDECIDGSPGAELKLSELASAAGVSTYHFCRQFKRSTGVSPWQYVLRWRVDRAAAMLATNPRTPVAAVAAACGFVDQSHLTRVFRRLRRLTPGQFRQSLSH